MNMIVLATHNKTKIDEMRYALKGLDYEVITLEELGLTHEVDEPYDDLTRNSFIKAKDASKYISSGIIVSEDTGFFVDAMDFKPGAYAGRYLSCLSQEERNKSIIAQVDAINRYSSKTNRKCSYAGVMTILHMVDGECVFKECVYEVCEGELAYKPRGNGGSAYDSILIPTDSNKTLAEMIPEEKMNYSHRYKLMKHLKHVLKRIEG